MKIYLSSLICLSILVGTVATLDLIYPAVILSQGETIAKNAREVTVRIDGPKMGSGVIVDRQGNTYTILTNWHVMDGRGQYRIISNDNRAYQVKSVKRLNGADLALVYFTSNQTYPLAAVGDSDNLPEGQQVHISGYPGPTSVARSRTYRFYTDTLNSRLTTPFVGGYQLTFSQAGISGMSGSPIFNKYGQLVGIFGLSEAAEGQQLSTYGIPIKTAIGLASRQQISPNWRTADKIGQTPQQLGKETYLAMVLKVKNSLDNMDSNAQVQFPAGVNQPIRLETSGTESLSRQLQVIGYFDADNKPKAFTPPELLELIANVSGIIASSRETLAQNKSPLTRQNQSLVIDLIVYNPRTKKNYRIPNVTIKAVCRDVMNAVLNRQLTKHDYNLQTLPLSRS